MEVNETLVENLAKLARLTFNEEEKAAIQKDLAKMIGFVDKLKELDTTGVAPLMHMSNRVNALREDQVQGSVDRATALSNAKDSEGIYFNVPKVIKK